MRAVGKAGISVSMFLLCASSSFATTRYVNVSNATPAAPYTNWAMASTNLQLAIDAAASGDEIQVSPGVYRTTNWVRIPAEKRLTLRSTVSRAAVMDAQHQSIALIISGTNSLVEGFTVRNALSDSYGGGIAIYSASTVRDCLVVSNQASGGAGIYINNNTSVVESCTIQHNLATVFGGGVLFYNHATGLVNNCIIVDNVATGATLNSNRLTVVDEIMRSTTRFIANREALLRQLGIEKFGPDDVASILHVLATHTAGCLNTKL